MTPPQFTVTPVRHAPGRPVVFHVHAWHPARRFRLPATPAGSFIAWTRQQALNTATTHGWQPAPPTLRLPRRLPTPTMILLAPPAVTRADTWSSPLTGITATTTYIIDHDGHVVSAHRQ